MPWEAKHINSFLHLSFLPGVNWWIILTRFVWLIRLTEAVGVTPTWILLLSGNLLRWVLLLNIKMTQPKIQLLCSLFGWLFQNTPLHLKVASLRENKNKNFTSSTFMTAQSWLTLFVSSKAAMIQSFALEIICKHTVKENNVTGLWNRSAYVHPNQLEFHLPGGPRTHPITRFYPKLVKSTSALAVKSFFKYFNACVTTFDHMVRRKQKGKWITHR